MCLIDLDVGKRLLNRVEERATRGIGGRCRHSKAVRVIMSLALEDPDTQETPVRLVWRVVRDVKDTSMSGHVLAKGLHFETNKPPVFFTFSKRVAQYGAPPPG